MRLRVLPALLLAAVLLLAAAAPSPAARPNCDRPKGTTQDANATARLFIRNRVLYSCLRRTGRITRVVADYDDNYVNSRSFGMVALAGRYVAYRLDVVDVSCKAACPPDYDTAREYVEVYDVVRRRLLRSVAATPTALAVTERGIAAWTEERGGTGMQVVRVWDGADPRQVGAGEIAPASLDAHRNRVTWIENGQVRGVQL